MRESVVVLSADFRILAANKAFWCDFSLNPEEATGISLFAVKGGYWDVQELKGLLESVWESNAPFYDYEARYRSLDGDEKVLLLNGRVLRRDDGGRGEVLLILQDVSELRQADEKWRSLQAELEQRIKLRTRELEAVNQELEAFSYSVSHDLRAPLRALGGFSEVLLEDYADHLDEEGREYLGHIRTAADQLSQLIDELLNLSRLTRSEMQYQEVNLTTVAKEVVRHLRVAEPARALQVHVEPDMVVRGDQTLLRVAIQNLLENAWKYTRNTKDAIVHFGKVKRGEALVFCVQDNGAGFDMQYADKLFRPFERLHNAYEFEGSGIGLAIVQRVLARHGGRVWAEGEVGAGAAFYFSLPT